MLYPRSQDVYREGRFAKAAEMLAGEKNFVPALVLRGKAEYLSGDLGAARKSLKRALSLKPGSAEASLFLARLCRETGDTKEAQKLTEKILSDNPQDIRALRFAAELAGDRGVAGEAAAAVLLDRAVEASAESALVFLDRARQRWIGGNSAGALEDLDCARVLLSKDSPAIKAVTKLESIISGVTQ
jgi:predicted Zn-dependent protease